VRFYRSQKELRDASDCEDEVKRRGRPRPDEAIVDVEVEEDDGAVIAGGEDEAPEIEVAEVEKEVEAEAKPSGWRGRHAADMKRARQEKAEREAEAERWIQDVRNRKRKAS
jgi:hypothetical protein